MSLKRNATAQHLKTVLLERDTSRRETQGRTVRSRSRLLRISQPIDIYIMHACDFFIMLMLILIIFINLLSMYLSKIII
jgi:hypothetical protein